MPSAANNSVLLEWLAAASSLGKEIVKKQIASVGQPEKWLYESWEITDGQTLLCLTSQTVFNLAFVNGNLHSTLVDKKGDGLGAYYGFWPNQELAQNRKKAPFGYRPILQVNWENGMYSADVCHSASREFLARAWVAVAGYFGDRDWVAPREVQDVAEVNLREALARYRKIMEAMGEPISPLLPHLEICAAAGRLIEEAA